jgi:hypothetical protein
VQYTAIVDAHTALKYTHSTMALGRIVVHNFALIDTNRAVLFRPNAPSLRCSAPMNNRREEMKRAVTHKESTSTAICAYISPRQIHTPHSQMPATPHFEQAIRPTTDYFWEDPLGVWNSRNIQHGYVQ